MTNYFQVIIAPKIKKIISIHVGQCGIQVASKFWQALLGEHGVDPKGDFIGDDFERVQYASSMLEETQNGKFRPRAILVDLEPGSIDSARASPYGQLFGLEDMVWGQSGAGNNWVKGFYTEGTELIDEIMDKISKNVEKCDFVQGFQLGSTIGGGTGSGLGSLILSKLQEDYPEIIRTTNTIFPVNKTDLIVLPYNALLSMPYLIYCADIIYSIDQEALYDIAFRQLKQSCPTYGNLNETIVRAQMGYTSSFRYPSQLNNTIVKQYQQSIAFSNMPFLSTGMFPISTRIPQNDINYDKNDINIIHSELFNPKNQLIAANPQQNHRFASLQITSNSLHFQAIPPGTFKDFPPLGNVQISNYKSYTLQKQVYNNLTQDETTVFFGQCTSIIEMFQRYYEQFVCMYRRKAFLHWYVGEGMEEGEFEQARDEVDELISRYQLIDLENE